MKLLGAMLVTLLEYPDRPWDWTAPTGNEGHLAVGYWKTGSKTESDCEGVVQPVSPSPTLVYPKEQALLDICRREVQACNQVWVYCQMTGKRDIQPRLKQILIEAGIPVAIMRSRSVKTRDRLEWIEKEGKKADIVISHPQLVQTGLDFFGKKPGSHNFNAIAFYETGYKDEPIDGLDILGSERWRWHSEPRPPADVQVRQRRGSITRRDPTKRPTWKHAAVEGRNAFHVTGRPNSDGEPRAS
jgi:hypothetical protein